MRRRCWPGIVLVGVGGVVASPAMGATIASGGSALALGLGITGSCFNGSPDTRWQTFPSSRFDKRSPLALCCVGPDARSWLSRRRAHPDSLSRARSSLASRVQWPGSPTARDYPDLQRRLDGDLNRGFRIGAPEGWPLLQCRAQALGLRRCVRLGGYLGSDASRAPPWPGRA